MAVAVPPLNWAQVVAPLVILDAGGAAVGLGDGEGVGEGLGLGLGEGEGLGLGLAVGGGGVVGGGVVGGALTQSFSVTESMRQPEPPTLTSLPIRQRSWTVWPAAAGGRVTVTVTKLLVVPSVPDQAWRPASGLPEPLMRVVV
jgi:hypothetical protein